MPPKPATITLAIFLASLTAALLCGCSTGSPSIDMAAAERGPTRNGLPMRTVFQGEDKFQQLSRLAVRENWAALPLGDRTMRVARELEGIPYGNFTLEISNQGEAPSVNFNALDCWTFYEIALGFARMVHSRPHPWSPHDLLDMIELERYRGGVCDGTYLSRMHFLEEVFHDNARRRLGYNPTRSLPGAERLDRQIRDMSSGWRQYPHLRANPDLVPAIAAMEKRVSRLPVYHIPKQRVAAIEHRIQNGDIIAITSNWRGSYTSHVGLALKQADGTVRFMHATSEQNKGRRVITDRRISEYLAERSHRAGIILFRPLDLH